MPTTIIGLLSDTHGRVETAARAVRLLREHGATLLIHLGDVGSEAVLEELVGSDALVVFGNCDVDAAALARHAERLGIGVCHPLGRIEIEGKTVAFSHGHLPDLLDEAAASGADYLLHGHTHVRRDERRNGQRIVNPGAVHRAAPPSVALLDPAADIVRFIELDAPDREAR